MPEYTRYTRGDLQRVAEVAATRALAMYGHPLSRCHSGLVHGTIQRATEQAIESALGKPESLTERVAQAIADARLDEREKASARIEYLEELCESLRQEIDR